MCYWHFFPWPGQALEAKKCPILKPIWMDSNRQTLKSWVSVWTVDFLKKTGQFLLVGFLFRSWQIFIPKERWAAAMDCIGKTKASSAVPPCWWISKAWCAGWKSFPPEASAIPKSLWQNAKHSMPPKGEKSWLHIPQRNVAV